MSLLVHGVVILGCAVLYVASSRTEPRRWRNGVFLLGIALTVLDAVEMLLLDGLAPASGWRSAVPLALPWLAATVIGILLVVGGVRRRSREGRSPGTVLSFVLGVGMTGASWLGLSLLLSGTTGPGVVAIVVLLLPCYGSLALLSYLAYCLDYARRRKRPAPAAIVVLGSGLVGGQVTRLLARRLDAALAVRRAEEAAGRRPLLVPSGGQGADEPVSEGAAMTAYLVGRGLDEHDVLTEDRARTTEENLVLSRELLRRRAVPGPVRVVTSSYHVGRAALIACRLELDADVTGAPTAWYVASSAFLREFAAALTYHPWINLAGLAVWAILTAVVTTIVRVG